jgi:hypothetical protein
MKRIKATVVTDYTVPHTRYQYGVRVAVDEVDRGVWLYETEQAAEDAARDFEKQWEQGLEELEGPEQELEQESEEASHGAR